VESNSAGVSGGGGESDEEGVHFLEQINDFGTAFGSDLSAQSKGLDDECERELEREEE
jgi:hypothetical protein